MEEQEIEQWDVDATEEPEADEPDIIPYQISYYPADFTLKGYLDKHKSGQLEIPPFQRDYVWDRVKASKLIESFLLGLPVPGVFLYKERETNKLQVIDGQQRILSAVRFFSNKFEERTFRLKNVNPKWEGKTFEELEESDQYQLSDTVLRATVVQQLDPQDDSSIYHIFERLNTGGINLNPMEIRKCVYHGAFFSNLEVMNEHHAWREILGKKHRDKRLRDIELILRVLALTYNGQNYEKPMKRFLNDFMLSHKKISSEHLSSLVEEQKVAFTDACDLITSALGEKPFHLRGRLNYAVLDSVLTTVIKNPGIGSEELSTKYNELKDNSEFIDSVSRNTSDESTLINRFRIVQSYLET